MDKRMVGVAMTMLGAACLSACAIGQRDRAREGTLENAAGFSVSNIASIQVSESVFHDSAWRADTVLHEELDVQYVKTKIDIQDLFCPKEGETTAKEQAYVLHVTTDIAEEVDGDLRFLQNTFYLSRESNHLYFAGKDANYRSAEPMDEDFGERLMRQPVSGLYHLSVYSESPSFAPDFPEPGNYPGGTTFSFQVQIVYDVSFAPYLNGVPLTPYQSDSAAGGYKKYAFKMPDSPSVLALSSDPFFPNRAYSFSEVFFWAERLNGDDLKGVRVEDGFLGVDPSSVKPEVRCSEDSRDISAFLAFARNAAMTKARPDDVDGGYYRVVTFILNDGIAYSFRTENEYVVWNDFSSYQYFSLSAETPLPDLRFPTTAA